MGQDNNKLILSMYEVNEIVNAIESMREQEDLKMTFNIKLGLIEDDLSDRATFYQQMYQQITNSSLEKDEEGKPIPVDEKGDELTKEQIENTPDEEMAYKLKDPQQYQEDLFELRTYPLDVSHVTEDVSINDFENLEIPKERRKRYADAFIPLIKGKSRVIRMDDENEVKPFKDVQEKLIDKHVPKDVEEGEENENDEEE